MVLLDGARHQGLWADVWPWGVDLSRDAWMARLGEEGFYGGTKANSGMGGQEMHTWQKAGRGELLIAVLWVGSRCIGKKHTNLVAGPRDLTVLLQFNDGPNSPVAVILLPPINHHSTHVAAMPLLASHIRNTSGPRCETAPACLGRHRCHDWVEPSGSNVRHEQRGRGRNSHQHSRDINFRISINHAGWA